MFLPATEGRPFNAAIPEVNFKERRAMVIRPSVRSSITRAVCCVVPAILLAACGGGGGSDPPAQQPSPLPSPPSVPPLATTSVKLQSQSVGTVSHWPSGDTATGGQGQTVDGLACGQMLETYHVHAHVAVFLNGDQLIVPDHIGIPSPNGQECTYSMHTHDGSGEIHIEAPAPATFTLGMLFDIWGQPLSTTNVGGVTGLPITLYYFDDGATKATEYQDDWSKLELTAHRQVTIQIGTAIPTIPVYDFDGA
jgi:hypothetical protein